MIFDRYELLFLIMSILPGLYLASKNELFYTENPKYNLFILRAPFLASPFVMMALLSYGIAVLIQNFAPQFTAFVFDTFGLYAASLIPLIISLITILLLRHLLKKYVFSVKSDSHSISEAELFVYLPKMQFPTSIMFGTRYEVVNKIKRKGELFIRSQISELVVEEEAVEGSYLSYGGFGDIVVSEEGLRILKEENLSGFSTRPVKKYGGTYVFSRPDLSNFRFYQLVCHRFMPKLYPLTEILTKYSSLDLFLVKNVTVSKNKFYYNQDALSGISDFNLTQEYFGSVRFFDHVSYKYWVVSKKARDVMVNRLEQRPKDFIPVYLVDDDGNVIDL